jgi:aerobic-type carbon monoxide dehydrogenase small subunit (CoxS/CutS family)
MMATKGLLDKNPNPTEDEMRDALSGNICRCTGYVRIMESAMEAAESA